MRCLKMTLLRLVFLKEFSKADHWPGCFCPQVFHNTIFFYWISVFVHHTKWRTASSFNIYDLEFSFSWSHSTGFKYGTKFLPLSLFTLLASQRCRMIWKEFKKNIYIKFLPSEWRHQESPQQLNNYEHYTTKKNFRQGSLSNAAETCSLR